MRLQRENDVLVFKLNLPECLLVANVLRELAEKYRLKPNELDAQTATAWYSIRGCITAEMSEEEISEWLGHLHAFKSTYLQHLEAWARQLGEIGEEHSALRIPIDDAAAFVTAINDYRLAAAARHAIGQHEMDIHSQQQLAKLPAARQEALWEIHFLAWMLEETLRALREA